MSSDLVLVTVESWRYDHRDHLPLPDDFETFEGITAGHYTRPSLAGLLTGRYRDAVQARPETPTLADRLRAAGYTTIGVSYSPQTARGMGFEAGFDSFEAIDPASGPVARGSAWRERLARFGPVRALHRRLAPKGATLDAIPTDDDALDMAIQRFDAASSPRFLWVHLMDTHRPYGRGDDALAAALDSKAAAAGPGRLQQSLSAAEHEQVVSAYRTALCRASDRLAAFLGELPSEARVVIAGDHGEEFGEQGYYYHGGYRQRLVDAIVRVPVAVRNLAVCGERVGLIDIAPTLAAAGGADLDGLDGVDRQWHPNPGALTVAPWAGRVAARWSGPSSSVFLDHDGARSVHSVAAKNISDDVEARLRALGYMGGG